MLLLETLKQTILFDLLTSLKVLQLRISRITRIERAYGDKDVNKSGRVMSPSLMIFLRWTRCDTNKLVVGRKNTK